MKKLLLSGAVALSLITLAACSSTSTSNSGSDNKTAASSKATTQSPEEKALSGLNANQTAQMKKAISYVTTMHMSQAGLLNQLTSDAGEKMSQADGQAIVNKLAPLVNWNNLAVLAAQNYRKTMNLTGQALTDQLDSDAGDKFTPDQAQYGVQHIEDKVASDDVWNK